MCQSTADSMLSIFNLLKLNFNLKWSLKFKIHKGEWKKIWREYRPLNDAKDLRYRLWTFNFFSCFFFRDRIIQSIYWYRTCLFSCCFRLNARILNLLYSKWNWIVSGVVDELWKWKISSKKKETNTHFQFSNGIFFFLTTQTNRKHTHYV